MKQSDPDDHNPHRLAESGDEADAPDESDGEGRDVTIVVPVDPALAAQLTDDDVGEEELVPGGD